jgi:hypothetical protein
LQRWRRRRLVVLWAIWPKRDRTSTTHLWSHVHYHLAKLFIIHRESLIFFGEMGHMLLQGRKLLDWVLDIDCKLPTIETLRAIRKFLAVVLESSYTWFLLGPLDDPASICKFKSKSRIIPVSLPQPAVICLLEIKIKIIKFNSRK